MNKIDAIVVHCSATKAGQDIGKKEITQMHLQRGFPRLGTISLSGWMVR
mgnify:CR=1 FL=1